MINKNYFLPLFIASTLTIHAGWINTDQVAQDVSNAWQHIKESPDKIRSTVHNALEKASNSFEITPGRFINTSVENSDTEVAFVIHGVNKDEVSVTIIDNTLRIAVQKTK